LLKLKQADELWLNYGLTKKQMLSLVEKFNLDEDTEVKELRQTLIAGMVSSRHINAKPS